MYMVLAVIAWMYVAIMMAVAEAMAPNGTILGALFTFLLYGALPAGLLAYILATPARKAKRRAQEAAQDAAAALASAPASSAQGDGSDQAPRTTQN